MIADVLEFASKAGTFPMQVLLLAGLITLACVIRRLHLENKGVAKEFMATIESERALMSKERIDRISMLMALIRDDSDTKAKLVCAIENNTRIIQDMKNYFNSGLRSLP